VFVGLNGTGSATYEISEKPGTYKGVKNSIFYSVGVNVIKQKIFSAIRNYDQEFGSFKIWSGARLPSDYAEQLTAEKMEIQRSQGKDRVVFTNKKHKRNEALDTMVYAIAMKAYIKAHRGRQGRTLFTD
jgi:phage terminase large subunit GpA-like protein